MNFTEAWGYLSQTELSHRVGKNPDGKYSPILSGSSHESRCWKTWANRRQWKLSCDWHSYLDLRISVFWLRLYFCIHISAVVNIVFRFAYFCILVTLVFVYSYFSCGWHSYFDLRIFVFWLRLTFVFVYS